MMQLLPYVDILFGNELVSFVNYWLRTILTKTIYLCIDLIGVV